MAGWEYKGDLAMSGKCIIRSISTLSNFGQNLRPFEPKVTSIKIFALNFLIK